MRTMRHLSIVVLTCLVVAGVTFAEPDAAPEHRALETSNNVRLTEKDIMPFLYWSLNQQQMSMSNGNRNRNQFVRGTKKPCDDVDEDLNVDEDDDEQTDDDDLEMDVAVQPLEEDEDYMEEPESSSIGLIEAYVDAKSGAIIISESAINSILSGNYISLSDREDEDGDDDGDGKANRTVRRRRGKGKKKGKRRGNKRRRNNRRRRPIQIRTRPRGRYN